MPETLVRLDDGTLVPDRRSPSMDVQQSLLKVITRMESMEENIGGKIEIVTEKVKNLDERLASRIDMLERRIDDHCDDEEEVNAALTEHDRKWTEAEKYVDRIHHLETNYRQLDTKVNALQSAVEDIKTKPQRVAFEVVKAVGIKLGWVLLGAIGLAILFAIAKPDFWQSLLK